jgi:secreted trypsin-like serine protease
MTTFKKFLLFSSLFIILNFPAHAFDNIVGGQTVTDEMHPTFSYTVRLLIKQKFNPEDAPELKDKGFTNKCSGVVISSKKILTAAHCFPETINVPINGKDRRVRLIDRSIGIYSWYKAGSPEISGVPADYYIVHPDYDESWISTFPDAWNPDKKVNDLAIIFYSRKLNYKKQPIQISKDTIKNLTKKSFRVSGFGKSSRSDIEISALRYVDISFNQLLNNEVDFALGNGYFPMPSEVSNPEGGCFGDSGGPIVVNNELVGLISRGPGLESGGCFSGITIGTSLLPYRDWIDSTK